MVKRLKLKGETSGDKFAHLERILHHISQRIHKTVTYGIPPVPISFYALEMLEDQFRMMSPLEGVIPSLIFYCDKVGKGEEVEFFLRVENPDGMDKHWFSGKSGKTIVAEKEIQLKVGSRISIGIRSGEEPITNVWIGFGIKPSTKEYDFTKIALEEFDFITSQNLLEVD